MKDKPKLIETWQELSELPPSDTHRLYISVDECCGWIEPFDRTKYSIYLSTHTFYGHEYENSTKVLQKCGFNIEIDNWDKKVE